MNPIAVAFLGLNALALLCLSRKWAPLPLLAGACYMTLGQGVQVGPFTFTVIRILVLVGVARVVVRGERLAGGINALDRIVTLWGVWVVASNAFHNDPEIGLVFRLGLAYNACGLYFLLRVFCASLEDIEGVCKITAILLVPLALEMVYEHVAFYNLFSVFGGVSAAPYVREGNIRALGPFAHPILAGTAGAVSLPLTLGIWPRHKLAASLGVIACVTIVLASRSSGPFMSAAVSIAAILAWPQRRQMRLFRRAFVAVYVLLDLVMKVPPYYLMARIDISGGSTGWHRARLIESSLEHLSEWWLYGTDHTRHWMPTGVSWNLNHTDITNHYLQMGVWGGLPLMFLFIAKLVKGFSYVGTRIADESAPLNERFLLWALGASLFAHVSTCISVSYFDQSVFFIYLTLAAIASAAQPLAIGVSAPVEAAAQPVGPAGFRWLGAAGVPVPARVGTRHVTTTSMSSFRYVRRPPRRAS
jgi:hypothetical protein